MVEYGRAREKRGNGKPPRTPQPFPRIVECSPQRTRHASRDRGLGSQPRPQFNVQISRHIEEFRFLRVNFRFLRDSLFATVFGDQSVLTQGPIPTEPTWPPTAASKKSKQVNTSHNPHRTSSTRWEAVSRSTIMVFHSFLSRPTPSPIRSTYVPFVLAVVP
jgi:hypothetical protein